MGNPILSYTSCNCFIQGLSTTDTNSITFRAYNKVTDAHIVCSQGSSGVANSGTLEFDCSTLKWSSNTIATQSWVQQNYMSNNAISVTAGQPISWLAGGYGGSIVANLVQNIGGYIVIHYKVLHMKCYVLST